MHRTQLKVPKTASCKSLRRDLINTLVKPTFETIVYFFASQFSLHASLLITLTYLHFKNSCSTITLTPSFTSTWLIYRHSQHMAGFCVCHSQPT